MDAAVKGREAWRRRVSAATAAAGLALTACASDPPAAPPRDDCRVIAVSSNGWHAGVYLKADDFPADGPIRAAFPDASWFAVGWGDARAYRASIRPADAVQAVLWPTPSSLHVAGLRQDPRTAYGQAWTDVALTQAGARRLAAALEAELARGADGQAVVLGPGLDPDRSLFLAGRSRYHAFNTCNVWMARHLNDAGAHTGWPPGRLLPGGLMRALSAGPSACSDPVARSRAETG